MPYNQGYFLIDNAWVFPALTSFDDKILHWNNTLDFMNIKGAGQMNTELSASLAAPLWLLLFLFLFFIKSLRYHCFAFLKATRHLSRVQITRYISKQLVNPYICFCRCFVVLPSMFLRKLGCHLGRHLSLGICITFGAHQYLHVVWSASLLIYVFYPLVQAMEALFIRQRER